MNRITLIAILINLLTINLSAQVVINEIQSSNVNTVTDIDGDFSDWIELYNAGSVSVNLNNYGLTDKPSNPFKWIFPNVSILPGDYLLVFASGKNLNNIGYQWETAVMADDYWRYFVGTSEPPSNWKDINFDDSGWLQGKGGCGYGDGDDSTLVPSGTSSVYMRKIFTIADTSKIGKAIFSIDYDDGFVAYLNGVEFARSGLASYPPAWDELAEYPHQAQMFQGGVPENYTIDQTLLSSLIVNGSNVLDIQVHNADISSPDLSCIAFLSFGLTDNSSLYGPPPVWFSDSTYCFLHSNFKIDGTGETIVLTTPAGVIADQKPSGYIANDNSAARIPDGASTWCVTDVSTPKSSNNGSICYLAYAPEPTFSLAPGFYTGSQNISISASLPGTEIHYTTNGSIPEITDSLFTSPIILSASTVLRARCFGPSQYLPGPTASNSYLINEPTTLPVVSIIAVPGDLFNDGSGGPAVYDNAACCDQQANTTSCTIQYFDSIHQYQFTRVASFKPVGHGSLNFPQKSIQLKYDKDYGSIGDVSYNIFSKDKPALGPSHGFRVRDMDNDAYSARMRDVVVNRMALNTYSGTAAYQNVAVYINGVYWGHYAARELLDQYFMRDNYGADADSVNIIKKENEDIGYYGYHVEEGSDISFIAMSDFLINNDLSDSALFNQAISRIDYKNWVDYFALEIYVDNNDWFPGEFHNNTEIANAVSPDISWKYILWDVSFSQGIWGSVSDDLLYNTLAAPSYPNIHTDMMNSLLQNSFFKNYFINRFADLMNYHWTNAKVSSIIDYNANEIAPEMNAHSQRWGDIDSASWAIAVQYLRDFHAQRPEYVRNHIQNYFGLNNQVNVTLYVTPPGAGKIMISTITPDILPWTGVYFNGNPVKITAIANPGYTFVDWSPNTIFSSANPIKSFTTNISSDDIFIANFISTPDAPIINVYPNPASTILNITSTSDQVTLIDLVDVMGRVVSTTKLMNGYAEVDISFLNNGVYIVQTDKGKGQKIVIYH